MAGKLKITAKSKRRADYEGRYGYKDLLGKHKLSDYGVWEIRGEDSNCDMGGHHSEPFLGFAEGTLDDVIDYAVDLPGFWAWGGGGRIISEKKHTVVKVNPEANAQRAAAKKKIEELEAALEAEKRKL